jgi:hypothetical protein
MTTKISLASRSGRGPELAKYRDGLQAQGIIVTSRWLAGKHQVSDDGLSSEGSKEERERFAQEDWDDLRRADIVIAFTEPPRSTASRGGRHVELGAALAYEKRVMIVGPRENVFCCLPEVEVFETWQQCMTVLIQELIRWLPKQTRSST